MNKSEVFRVLYGWWISLRTDENLFGKYKLNSLNFWIVQDHLSDKHEREYPE